VVARLFPFLGAFFPPLKGAWCTSPLPPHFSPGSPSFFFLIPDFSAFEQHKKMMFFLSLFFSPGKKSCVTCSRHMGFAFQFFRPFPLTTNRGTYHGPPFRAPDLLKAGQRSLHGQDWGFPVLCNLLISLVSLAPLACTTPPQKFFLPIVGFRQVQNPNRSGPSLGLFSLFAFFLRIESGCDFRLGSFPLLFFKLDVCIPGRLSPSVLLPFLV